jgi:hypothetical protein
MGLFRIANKREGFFMEGVLMISASLFSFQKGKNEIELNHEKSQSGKKRNKKED